MDVSIINAFSLSQEGCPSKWRIAQRNYSSKVIYPLHATHTINF